MSRKSARPGPAELIYRRATHDDLPGMWAAFWDAQFGPKSERPPIPYPAIFRHELETGEVWVAEDAAAEGPDRIVGLAALIIRGDVAHLSELFVRRRLQGGGVGRALLGRVLEGGGRLPDGGRVPPGGGLTVSTLSSSDPRALALYIEAGLVPRWTHFHLTGTDPRLSELPGHDLRVTEADLNDPELAEWDARSSGRSRAVDLTYWRSTYGAKAVWLTRGSGTVGYAVALVRMYGPETPQVSVGPIGAASPADAADCVGAACRWGWSLGDGLYLAVPGPHPALRPLLLAGFRLSYTETFLSRGSDGDHHGDPAVADPRGYLPAGGPEGSSLF